MVDIRQFLSHVLLFKSMSAQDRDDIALVASVKSIQKGEMLFIQGEIADSFYIMVSGKCKNYKLTPEGEELILYISSDGDLVGETAIFNELEYTGTCEILKDSILIHIPKDEIVKMLLQRPHLSLAMLASYAQRLRELTYLIEFHSMKSSRQRVIYYLLKNKQYQNDIVYCPLIHSKKEIATLIGVAPETFSRVLHELKLKKLISESDKKIFFNNLFMLMNNISVI